MFKPISPGSALSAIATVTLAPLISTMFPGLISNSRKKELSTLTIPLLTSSCIASATLSLISFVMVIPSNKYF
jgi:hypothetical protein